MYSYSPQSYKVQTHRAMTVEEPLFSRVREFLPLAAGVSTRPDAHIECHQHSFSYRGGVMLANRNEIKGARNDNKVKAMYDNRIL